MNETTTTAEINDVALAVKLDSGLADKATCDKAIARLILRPQLTKQDVVEAVKGAIDNHQNNCPAYKEFMARQIRAAAAAAVPSRPRWRSFVSKDKLAWAAIIIALLVIARNAGVPVMEFFKRLGGVQ